MARLPLPARCALRDFAPPGALSNARSALSCRATRPRRRPSETRGILDGRRAMERTTPPYRADHVGSFLRPRRLLEARVRHARDEITAEALREMEDDAIREVVRRQEEVGLQGITDGEFRRTFFHVDFLEQLDGV